MRLVPPFDELEIDKYFQHFEKVAENLKKWPKDYWPLMLQSALRGKAQQAYSALSVDEASKYDVVKKAILTAYELVPEAYRQKFRGLRRNENQNLFLKVKILLLRPFEFFVILRHPSHFC